MASTTIATTTYTATLRGASTDDLDSEYLAAAMEFIRELIDPVPGSGNILGVWMYKGVIYAFRNNEVGDAANMYKETPTGWALVTTPELAPDGRYEFRNYNFYGASDLLNMYGVDGANPGFMFDGTTFTQLSTGMVVDKPNHLSIFKYHLFFSFPGGSVQHSAPGNPEVWSAILGAAELAIGQECVGFADVPGEALAIYGRNKTLILKGTGVADWVLNTHDEEAGAVEWTIQKFKQPIVLDDRGLTTLTTTQAFGDFKAATLTQRLQKIIKLFLPKVRTSMRVKEKDQYRLFLNDGRMLFVGMNGSKTIGATIVNYGTPMVTAVSIEDLSGNEILLAGCTAGFVYKLDSGTNFDGGEVDAYIRPVFNHSNSPEQKKRYFKAVLEIEAAASIDLIFLPVFGYGDPYLPSAAEQTVDVLGGGGIWDGSDTHWRDFFWDTQVVASAEGYIDGIGKNLSMFIRSVGTYEKPHTIQGIIIHYSPRGIDR